MFRAFTPSALQPFNPPAFQLFSSSTFQLFSTSPLQLFNSSALEFFSPSAIQLFSYSTLQLLSAPTFQSFSLSTLQFFSPSALQPFISSVRKLDRCIPKGSKKTSLRQRSLVRGRSSMEIMRMNKMTKELLQIICVFLSKVDRHALRLTPERSDTHRVA